MARSYPAEVRRGLRLQALGNDIIALLGGRSVHPVGACVGGFYRLPDKREINNLKLTLNACYDDVLALLDWTAGLPLPDDRQAFCCVALQHADEYPMNEGRIRSSAGLDIAAEAYEQHFEEFQVPHSTALHAGLHGQPYLVGPLARLNLNRQSLPPAVRQALDATGIAFPSDNMFHSTVARAAEILFAVTEALRILNDPPDPGPARVEVQRHLEAAHDVHDADNSPRAIFTVWALGLSRAALRLRAETVIRNYDPCISCATHFLHLNLQRREP